MPLYEMNCENCNQRVEVSHPMSSDDVYECELCGQALKRIFSTQGLVKGEVARSGSADSGSSRPSEMSAPSMQEFGAVISECKFGNSPVGIVVDGGSVAIHNSTFKNTATAIDLLNDAHVSVSNVSQTFDSEHSFDSPPKRRKRTK